jgi:hypothetical protein
LLFSQLMTFNLSIENVENRKRSWDHLQFHILQFFSSSYVDEWHVEMKHSTVQIKSQSKLKTLFIFFFRIPTKQPPTFLFSV